MRRRTVRLATIAVVLGGVLVLGAGAAQAHPLGNFTINLYDGLAIRSHGIDVDHVIDMAEIPAFQERSPDRHRRRRTDRRRRVRRLRGAHVRRRGR